MTIESGDREADVMPGLSRRPAGMPCASGFSCFIYGMFWISLLLALLPLEIELTDAAGHEKRNVKYCPEVKPCICNTEVSILNTSFEPCFLIIKTLTLFKTNIYDNLFIDVYAIHVYVSNIWSKI